jgi:cytochrome c peroxidase
LLFIISCQPEPIDTVPDFGFFSPPHFPAPVYTNPQNPITKEGFELGRQLFFDPILSRDSSISCGSCHAQAHAFADHNTALSTGIDGRTGSRNTPALSNLAWYPSFMHDGGINHLEVMPLAPITEKNEMDEELSRVIAKLNANSTYKTSFEKVFGQDAINSQQLFYALAQFQSMLVSANSKYDRYLLGDEKFSEQEERGLVLFRTNCATCHTEPLTTDFSFVNKGLEMHAVDAGRARITLNPADSGKFRVPSLRNVALTHPYMHDGRFYTLEKVLDHYSAGILQNGRLDARLSGNIALTESEKQDIITFLHTLTDYTLLANPLFGEPKK